MLFVLLLLLLTLAAAVLPVTRVPLRYNLRNLQARWKTSLVTGLAFTVVIGLLTFMLAFVKGMDRLTEGSGVPGNVMILSDGATDEAFSNLPYSGVEVLPSELQQMIVKKDGKFLATQEVYIICVHTIPNPEPGARKRRFVQMRGLDNARIAAEVHQIELATGEWFSDAGVRRIKREHDGTLIEDTAPEIVLGDGIARTFGADLKKETVVPGDVVQIGPRFWYVVGVMKANNSSYGSEIWAKDGPVRQTFGRKDSFTSYVVRTASEEIGRKAAELLKQVRTEKAMQAQTELQYFAKLTRTNSQFRFAFLFVAVVMAVGGVLSVMNTMFAAISQRTKDIGVMRLLGYTRFMILCSFLLESMVIALVGGTLGCFLGGLTDGWSMSSIVSSGAGGGGKSVVLRLTVDSSVVGTALLFTYLMGAVGGLVPALSAMRLKPLESLR
jgi:ABC-type lipoprotein release transport system permease subunit